MQMDADVADCTFVLEDGKPLVKGTRNQMLNDRRAIAAQLGEAMAQLAKAAR